MKSPTRGEQEHPGGVVRGAGDATALRLAARILDTAPVAIAYVSAGLAVLQCNAAAARAFGMRAEEVLGRPLHDSAPGSGLLDAAREASVSLRPATGLLRKADGIETLVSCTPDVDAKGRLLGLLLTGGAGESARDATTDDAIRDSETLFGRIFDLSPAGVLQLDTEGRFIRVNRRFADMLGFEIEQLEGMSWAEITHPDDVGAGLAAFHLLADGECDEVSLEKRYLRADGKPLWTLVALSAVRDLEGGLRLALGVVQDISEHKHAEELTAACTRIDAAANSTLDAEDVIRRVVVEAVEALHCDSGRVVMREGDRWMTRFGYRLPEGTEDSSYTDDEVPEFGLAARTRRVAAIDDAQNDPRTNGGTKRSSGMRSLLVVPLVLRDEVPAVISFAYRTRRQRFTAAGISLAEHVAASASAALENAQLYDTQHALADTLQGAMVRMPERVEGIAFSWLYRSATEAARVGGDFLDVFPLHDGRVGVLVGDVSGKGVEASALTTLVKNVARAYAYEDPSPARIMQRLNRTVELESAEDVFATAFLAVLDPGTGWLSYCSGGHPPGLLRRADGTVRPLLSESPLVGALPEMAYEEGYEQLAPGDVLLLFSDGVLEARNMGRAEFGEDRVMAAFAGSGELDTVCETIFQAVSSFSEGSLEDDVALLAVALDAEAPPTA